MNILALSRRKALNVSYAYKLLSKAAAVGNKVDFTKSLPMAGSVELMHYFFPSVHYDGQITLSINPFKMLFCSCCTYY